MDEMEEFKQTFFDECSELLTDMEERLMHMEEASEDIESLNAIFRCAHSIKGGAGAFGMDAIMNFTHTLEALLDKMREGQLPVTQNAIDLLLQSGDKVTQMLEMAQDGTEVPEDFVTDISMALEKFSNGGASEASSAAPAATDETATEDKKIIAPEIVDHSGSSNIFHIRFAPSPELLTTGNDPIHIFNTLKKLGKLSVEVSYKTVPTHVDIEPTECYLDWNLTLSGDIVREDILEAFEFVEDLCELEINEESQDIEAAADSEIVENGEEEEQVTTPLPTDAAPDAPDETAPAKTPAAPAAAKKPESGGSIRVDLDRIDRIVNMVGELVITEAMLRMQTNKLELDRASQVMTGLDELSHHTRELQEAVMAVRMQPVKSIFSRMPRLVREIAGKLDKDIQLITSGEQTEVDKTVIEQLGDPLTHMIRNSVDHGIEMPEVREEKGKPRKGTIQLLAYHQSGRIIIEIQDDGNGINREKVLEKAKEKGLIDANATPSDEEIDQMIFMPGFSTADQVSDVSGRGVGMDVVRRNIEEIGGVIHVNNRPGEGSTIQISLPLTLAILDGMIIRIGAEHYIVPITSIIESLKPEKDAIKIVEGHGDVMNVRGEFIPLIYLNKVFDIDDALQNKEESLVVLVESRRQKMGLVVDELVGQQQVVIKSLEANADPVPGISGATILGDGRVSLILDIDKLWRLNQQINPMGLPPSPNSRIIEEVA